MKQERMQSIRDNLCILLNYLLFFAAVITISDLFQVENPNLLLWATLVVIPLGVVYLIKKEPVLIPPPIFIFLLGVMSLAEKIMTVHDWGIYYYVITFVYLIGYFLFYFTKKFLDFLKLNQNTASKIPVSDIFRNGLGLTGLFTACSCVILLVTANIDWVKVIADKIWSWILVILRYIFSGIETKPPLAGKEEITQKDPQMGSSNMSDVIPIETLESIRNIIIVMLIVTIIIGLCLFIYYIYFVIKGMEDSDIKNKKKENLAENEDVREYCGIEKNIQRKAGSFLFRNNREKIRRLYQKKMIKRKKELIGEQEQQLLKYLTAKECCDKLSEQQLKLVYEKARYSEEILTAEDVKCAK